MKICQNVGVESVGECEEELRFWLPKTMKLLADRKDGSIVDFCSESDCTGSSVQQPTAAGWILGT